MISLPGQIPEVFDNVGPATSAASTASFAGGTDGTTTITGSVLVGVDAVPRKGLYALRGTGASVAVLADADDSTQWTSQVAYGLSEGTYMVMTGPAGDTITNAVSAKATAGIDSYAAKLLFGDWVYFSDAANGQTRLISPQGYAAGKLAALSPEQSGLNKPLQGVVGTQKSFASQQYSERRAAGPRPGRDRCRLQPGAGGQLLRAPHRPERQLQRGHQRGQLHPDDQLHRLHPQRGDGHFHRPDDHPADERREAKATLDSFFSALKDLKMIDSFLVVLDSTNNTPNREALGYQTADCKVRYLSIVNYLICNLEGGTVGPDQASCPAPPQPNAL